MSQKYHSHSPSLHIYSCHINIDNYLFVLTFANFFLKGELALVGTVHHFLHQFSHSRIPSYILT